jgi:hypothetical protein
MLALLICLTVAVPASGWQTYTNTNFVNDMVGNDTTLYLATNGGVVELQLLPTLETRRMVVNTDGLPYNKCLCIAEDVAGNLWVGTDGGGLAVIAGESLTVRPYRASEIATRIRCLAWDGDRLLAGSDQGLYCIDTRGTLLDFEDDDIRRFSVARNPELLSDQIMAVAAYDRYWIGTNRGATAVGRDFTGWSSYRRPHGDSVSSFALWQDSVMIATELGLAVKQDSLFRPVFSLSRATGVYDLVVYSSTIYLATKSGLYVGDSAAQSRFQLVLGDDSRALRLGSAIWVGCGGNEQTGSGIRYLQSGQTWSTYLNSCIASDAVIDCAVGGDGSVLLCHGGPITWMPSPGEYRVLWSPSPIPIQARFDNEGRQWFGHFAGNGGLSVYTPSDQSWQTLKWGEQSSWNIIDAFGIDRSDCKWVYNGGNVVVAIESDGRQTVFEVPGLSAPPGGLYEFAFDWAGRTWLGLTVGLVMIDHKNTIADRSDDEYRVISQGLPAPEVRTVAVDDRGRVWVGTAQGAAYWDGEQFHVFTHENTDGGLLSDNVYRIRADASSRVWLLCDQGLVIYDPVTTRWENYGAGGLVSNPLGIDRFYGALDVSSLSGRVAVGTQRGVCLRDFGITAPPTAERMRVYPNPCVLDPLNPQKSVVIDSLSSDITSVRVYTIDGRPVRWLWVDPALRRATWNPSDVSSGLYLLMVTGPAGTRVERVAVVRP